MEEGTTTKQRRGAQKMNGCMHTDMQGRMEEQLLGKRVPHTARENYAATATGKGHVKLTTVPGKKQRTVPGTAWPSSLTPT